jgi:hypothetical protein
MLQCLDVKLQVGVHRNDTGETVRRSPHARLALGRVEVGRSFERIGYVRNITSQQGHPPSVQNPAKSVQVWRAVHEEAACIPVRAFRTVCEG